MNISNSAATLIQATNIILLLKDSNFDIRKFVAWRIDKDKPEEVLSGLQILDITFEDSIKLFEHPLETGAVVTDHMITDPSQVSLQAYISNDDATTLKELEYLCLNGIPLKLRVQNKIIPRAVIKSKPFKLSGAHFDKSPYSISFREEQEVMPVYTAMPPKKVQKKTNASRVNSGVKQAKSVKKSWLKSALIGGRT